MEECVSKFLEGIGNLKNDLENPNDENSITAAIKLAYGDAKRTLNGIGGQSEKRDKAIKEIKEKFINYFNNNSAYKNENDFNDFHKKLCRVWTDNLQGDLGTVGKAQKIVNMTFKYLYCCKKVQEDESLKEYFKFCHMPLDSFTLEWLYRKNGSLCKTKIAPWSAVKEYGDKNNACYTVDDNKEYYTYYHLQEKIKELVETEYKGKSLLQTEIVIWPEIQKHMIAENFYFSICSDLTNSAKSKYKECSLKEKFEMIKDPLNKYIESI